jgi:hypothetical protein
MTGLGCGEPVATRVHVEPQGVAAVGSPGGASEGSLGRVCEPGGTGSPGGRWEPPEGVTERARGRRFRRPSGTLTPPYRSSFPGLEDSPGATLRRPSGAQT